MLRALVLGTVLVPVISLALAAQTMQTAPSAASGASPQAAPAPSANPAPAPTSRRRGADISRDEYIQRAVDRARRSAETRFDRMDANHDGILTADERRAARAARRGATQ